MKILYVATGNGLNPAIGGSLGRSIEIASRLKRAGQEIYFLTTSGGFRACRDKGLDARYYLLPAALFRKEEQGMGDRMLAYIISTTAAFWKIRRLPACDIVYSDSDYFCDVIPAILYKLNKKAKWAAISHHRITTAGGKTGLNLINRLSSGLQRWSYSLFKKYADGVLVCDSAMGEEIAACLTAIGIPPVDIHRVTNGADLKYIQQLPPQKKTYDACFVGGLRPNKGIYDIVPIWAKVAEKKPGALLVVAGGGMKEYEGDIRRRVRKSGLEENIRLLGPVPHPEGIKTMQRSRIFISPSYQEGFGTAVCEALACGLQVVAYDLPVYRSCFGKAITTVPVGDVDGFAAAVTRLCADGNEGDLLNREGLKVAAGYDWDKVAEEELGIFREIAAGRTRRGRGAES